MATAIAGAIPRTLKDPELKQHLQRLRAIGNVRNLFDVARSWLFLIAVLAAAVVFSLSRADAGHHWAWDVPVYALAVVLVGAGQHQLTALGHEGSHHVLLKNRLANELVSDWFCMFPVFSTTHHYRLQHLAHHQFVNDPELDPNFSQLQVNGHWTDFPMTKGQFWREFAQQLLPWNMLNYLRATAVHNAMAGGENPYQKATGPAAHRAKRVGLVYLFSMIAVVVALVRRGDAVLLYSVVGAMWAAMMVFLAVIPAGWYTASRIHSTVPIRYLSLMRITWMTGFFLSAAGLSLAFGPRVLVWFGVLWIVPLFTSFAFFMMMRQMVQHSNGDRGWLTNTRIFLVNKLIRDSILPYGQDYHLPHHLYATVPHYRLKELHELLMEYPEYREQAVIAENAVLPKYGHDRPTIVEVLAEYAPGVRHAAHVDNTVLENCEVEERDEILRAASASANR